MVGNVALFPLETCYPVICPSGNCCSITGPPDPWQGICPCCKYMPVGKATPAAGDTRKKLCPIVRQQPSLHCEPPTLNLHPDCAETQTTGAGLPWPAGSACASATCSHLAVRNLHAKGKESWGRTEAASAFFAWLSILQHVAQAVFLKAGGSGQYF